MIQLGNAVEVEILAALLAGDHSLRLFQNDVDAGMTAAQRKAITNASFTEATFAGYSAVTLTFASWTITGGLPTAAVNTLRTFERSSTGAAQTVRGYWIRRSSDSLLRCWEKFPGPLTFEFLGDRYRFTPRLPAKDGDDG
jgi:hypothetical protein